jgi:hypothetical protein
MNNYVSPQMLEAIESVMKRLLAPIEAGLETVKTDLETVKTDLETVKTDAHSFKIAMNVFRGEMSEFKLHITHRVDKIESNIQVIKQGYVDTHAWAHYCCGAECSHFSHTFV